MKLKIGVVLMIVCALGSAIVFCDDLQMRDGEYYVTVQTIPMNAGQFGSQAGYAHYKMYFGKNAVEFSILDGKKGKYRKNAKKVNAPFEFEIPYATLVNAVYVVFANALGEPMPNMLIFSADGKRKIKPQGFMAHRSKEYRDGNEKRIEGEWFEELVADQSDDFFYIDRIRARL